MITIFENWQTEWLYDKRHDVYYRWKVLEDGEYSAPMLSIADTPNMSIATVYDSSILYESYQDAVKSFKKLIKKESCKIISPGR